MLIKTSAVGLPIQSPGVYIASESLNNWCQEMEDFSQQPRLTLSSDQDYFQIDGHDLGLQEGEEFKLLIPYIGAKRATEIYATRMDADRNSDSGVHVDRRFDFNPAAGHFWFLACSHRIVRRGHWNQNNVY